MGDDDIVIAGLSSVALRNLSSALHLPRLETSPVTHMSGNYYRSNELDLSGIEGGLDSYLGNAATRSVLVVYLTPWGFLEELVSIIQASQGSVINLERLGKEALGIWTTYHGSALAARAHFSNRCLLINGHRPIEEHTVADLVQKRHRAHSVSVKHPKTLSEPVFALMHEEAFWQLVCDLAPECLEIYASLESCAELLGRQPEFGFDRFPRRNIGAGSVLRLLPETLPTSPFALERDVQIKLEPHLLQLHRTRLELARLIELGRKQNEKIADLQQRLKVKRLAILHKTVRKCMDMVFPLASRLAEPIGYAARVEAIRNRWTLSVHVRVIRSSGLFDDKWYIDKYPDVATCGIDPIEHFLRFGATDRRNPSARFDTRWYLNAYPDVARAGLNPLLHYIEFGSGEGRRPKRRFKLPGTPSC